MLSGNEVVVVLMTRRKRKRKKIPPCTDDTIGQRRNKQYPRSFFYQLCNSRPAANGRNAPRGRNSSADPTGSEAAEARVGWAPEA